MVIGGHGMTGFTTGGVASGARGCVVFVVVPSGSSDGASVAFTEESSLPTGGGSGMDACGSHEMSWADNAGRLREERSGDDWGLSSAIIAVVEDSEGLRICLRDGLSDCGAGISCLLCGACCTGGARRVPSRCTAIMCRGETGSDFGAAGSEGGDVWPGRANAQRGHGRSEGHR